MIGLGEKSPGSEFPPPGRPRDHSPALAWLSLAGLLPSMARLRFTKRIHCTKDNEEVTEEDSHKIDAKDST